MNRTRFVILCTATVLAAVPLLVGPTMAREGRSSKAGLTGWEEVPSVSTPATGQLRTSVVNTTTGPEIVYVLTYSDIQNAFAAHIHLGQVGVNGGVSAFLCGGGDKPPCPPTGGTVAGTIDRPDVIGPSTQGIEPGEIEELVEAMRVGVTYANVHTTDGNNADPPGPPGDFPGGEIRGQIK
ncbi:MAG TPA: CHRD domain-containing protein [Actinomycetota bacterium]|nr:CHRD domain-containing protein [Actinomycetota bacterium]